MKNRRRHAGALLSDASEPLVNEMDKPGIGWIPIRCAPIQYQAIEMNYWKRTLTSKAIVDFAKKAVGDPGFIGFYEVDPTRRRSGEKQGSIVLLGAQGIGGEAGPGTDLVFPYAPYEAIDSADGSLRPVAENVAARICALWTEMEIRFRTAHRIGDCRVLARCGSPIAEHFTSLAPDVFDAFKLIDWRNGVGVSLAGDRLYSIHAAAPANQKAVALVRQFENSPLKLCVGQYLCRHHPNGLVGDKITSPIIRKIRQHCIGTKDRGRLDEKTIREAYKLFRDLLSSKPSAELMSRIQFDAAGEKHGTDLTA